MVTPPSGAKGLLIATSLHATGAAGDSDLLASRCPVDLVHRHVLGQTVGAQAEREIHPFARRHGQDPFTIHPGDSLGDVAAHDDASIRSSHR